MEAQAQDVQICMENIRQFESGPKDVNPGFGVLLSVPIGNFSVTIMVNCFPHTRLVGSGVNLLVSVLSIILWLLQSAEWNGGKFWTSFIGFNVRVFTAVCRLIIFIYVANSEDVPNTFLLDLSWT